MKPAPFEYHSPTSIEACLALLAEYNEEASLLAGGQSLLPLMRFRLAQPNQVITIRGIGGDLIDSIPTVDWEFVTEPQVGANNRAVHYARGKCLGGSSALNFMIHHRGSAGSYQQWADEVGDQSYT